MTNKVSTLREFVDTKLRALGEQGRSLRSIARDADFPPSMLSQIRHGRLGVPLPRLASLARAFALSPSETQEFQRLVRSDQAQRAIHRGTSYVQELESDLGEVLQLLGEVVDWARGLPLPLPSALRERIERALGSAMALQEPLGGPSQAGPPPGNPWIAPPEEDSEDFDRLEARNVQGAPIMAEYRMRVRDRDGLLLAGEVAVARGIREALSHLCQAYRTGSHGRWAMGWYEIEVVRKVCPGWQVRLAGHATGEHFSVQDTWRLAAVT